MPAVLTTASSVTCGHSGTLAVPSEEKLRVEGAAVLVASRVESAEVKNCRTEPDPNTSTVKCLKATSLTAGKASKLTSRGEPVVLETLAGLTSGTVGGVFQPFSAEARQERLTAR